MTLSRVAENTGSVKPGNLLNVFYSEKVLNPAVKPEDEDF